MPYFKYILREEIDQYVRLGWRVTGPIRTGHTYASYMAERDRLPGVLARFRVWVLGWFPVYAGKREEATLPRCRYYLGGYPKPRGLDGIENQGAGDSGGSVG